jgi:hypothetical protein
MKTFKKYLNEVAKPTGDLKKACWTGYTAVGTKKKNGRTVPNCVPEEVELDEEDTKVKHVHHNGEKIGETGVDSESSPGGGKWFAKHYKSKMDSVGFDSRKEAEAEVRAAHGIKEEVEFYEQYNAEELFDILEEVVDGIAEENNIDPDILWENLEDVSDEELYESAAWRRKEGKNPTGGLNAKGIASYRRENPGSKLKRAVTGKVKPGSKAAKRRKSFCARMGGMKGPMKKPNGKPTRKALALRKWKCR